MINQMNPLATIEKAFAQSLGVQHPVRLIGGFDEPLYLPATDSRAAEIRFRGDYPSSALHEVAHWCLAGARRRALQDYGYWYEAHRGVEAQHAFENVEARPQALEWVFSQAVGCPFRVSADNLSIGIGEHFREMIRTEACLFTTKMPPDGLRFAKALAKLTGHQDFLSTDHYLELPR
jgi:elongation factor P hydroxylase